MRKGEEYYFFQFSEKTFSEERIQLFFRNYHLKRSAKGIKVRGLASENVRENMKNIYNLPHTRIRYLKKLTPTGTIIYKDKVLIIDWEKVPTAFVINSKQIAKSYKEFFEENWKTASK